MGVDGWALLVAAVAVVLSLASLGWQVKTHRDGGVRVKVSFVAQLHDTGMVAKVTRKGCAVVPKGDEPRDLAVKVQNVGRQPAVVVGVHVGTEDIAQVVENGARLPVRLDVSEESSVGYLTSEDVCVLLDANATAAKKTRRKVSATVQLGNGTTATTSLPVDVLEALYRDARAPKMPWGMFVY